jgi:AsmA protein
LVIVKIFFKWVTTSLIAVVTLVSAAIIYVSLAVDINGFKPDIESRARQQGWDLTIDGDLAWTFFPQPGISIEQVRFSDQVAASGTLDSLTLSVGWIDLLSTGGDVSHLQGGSIQVNGGQLLYKASNSLPMQLDNISLKTSNILLDGSTFPLTASMQALSGQKFSIAADIAVVANSGTVQSLSLSDLTVLLNDIEISGSIEASNSLSFIEGSLQTNTFSLVQQLERVAKILPIVSVPKMADPSAMTNVSIESRFTFDTQAISDIDSRMMLDGQTIEIGLQVDHQRNKLTTLISADVINASNYLPKPGSNADNSSLFAPLAIPFALWRGQSQVEITLGSVQFNDFSVDNFYSNVFGNNRVLRMTSLNADLFGGQINAIAKLDMRSATPEFSLQPVINSLDLGAALPVLADNKAITGIANLTASIQGSGNSLESIIKSLSGSGQFDIGSPSYNELNIEQTFCNAAAFFSSGRGGQSSQQWAPGTELQDLRGKFQLNRGNLKIDDYSTATGNLDIAGRGSVDLVKQQYSIAANVLLDSAITSNTGCSVNQRLQNRQIPFVCKGSFGKGPDNSAYCKPDEKVLKSLLKNTVFEGLSEKLGESLLKNADKDEGDPLKGLLNNLLKRKLK